MSEKSNYKVKDPVSGLYWKGGGMNKNNKSSSFIHSLPPSVDFPDMSKYTQIDYNSETHALATCFSKNGKTWSSLRAVKSALGWSHEDGLNKLLGKCEIIELVCTEKIIKR